MFTDTHTHSKYSADSSALPEESIISAIGNGLSGITFTEHYDPFWPDPESVYDFDFAEYLSEISLLKEKYKGKIEVYAGLEAGFRTEPDIKSVIDERLKPFLGSFDFIIGSTHIIGGGDPYEAEFFENQSKKSSYEKVLREIAENLALYEGFDALGHFDYHTRLARFEDKRLYYKEFPDLIDSILLSVVSKGLALEINTKTYRDFFPDFTILKRYRDLGGELITLGSDAHVSSQVGFDFERNAEFLRHCGFRFVMHYKERKIIAESL